jgi:outer membrane receptor protein involved in Fe transport
MFKRSTVCNAVVLALGGAMAAGTVMAQERITITGSRILRIGDLTSSSPMVTIGSEQLLANQDITIETMLNNLPQVNPAGTTTSNNPGNGGQANIDLRGLGANRNLILIDGRRPMVSASDQSVDLNTIPLSMIESIEVISGGASAVYGADAVAGVVNVKLKRRFQGLDLRLGTSNAMEKRDAREENFSVVGGANFDGNRGNATFGFETARRQKLIKSQRDFAAVATSTTSFFPEGTYRPSGTNLPTQAAVDALYGQASYGGSAAGTVPNSAPHGFNLDGTLFYGGIFNSPRDVLNWRYPIDTGVNTNLFPDVYSYNFDAVNILTLPLERQSLMGRMNFQVNDDLEVFGRVMSTRYTASSALAPTPVSTVTVASPTNTDPQRATSPLVVNGQNVGTQLIVPTTNPFIPADLRTLLNSRTGDDARIVGAGASEPFLMRWRTLGAGLRQANYVNNVSQVLAGAKGNLFEGWSWEASLSSGKTVIRNTQTGNIDTDRLLQTLNAADGGASLCAGGVNPFGRQPLSAACATYLSVDNTIRTTFDQTIGQAFVSGDLVPMPAGPLAAVLGVEFRNFKYVLDPGTASGPISGFNTQSPAGGKNDFKDVFAELQFPLVKKAPLVHSLDLGLALRTSQSGATDTVQDLTAEKRRSNSWAVNTTWAATPDFRTRLSLQKTVRAANFGELFDGGGSAPQYYDPCSVTSVGRTTGANAAQLRTLCQNAGSAGGLGAAVDTYVQTPGTQASITTAGNVNLKPETGDSVTLGFVFSPTGGMLGGFTATVDYYRILVKDAITVPDTNEFVADCYNYYGRNPTYSPTYSSCAGIFRAGDILGVDDPADVLGDGSGRFAGSNEGRIKTHGVDMSLGWTGAAGPGRLGLLFNLNYLLGFESKTAAFLDSREFKGTVPYFGAGLGQAFPKLKGLIAANYNIGPVSLDARMRYIDKMTNRMSVMFPGEKFTGTPAVTYFDVGGGYEFFKGASIRVGVNNVMDKKPPTYAPNVQSGTDPSSFDVIGRRLFVQGNLQFK